MAATHTYDVDLLATSAVVRVRRTIGDIGDNNSWAFADQEIEWAILMAAGGETLAAIGLLDALSIKYASLSDVAAGSQRLSLSKLSGAYAASADRLRASSGLGSASDAITADPVTRVDGYSDDVAADEVRHTGEGTPDAPYGYAPW